MAEVPPEVQALALPSRDPGVFTRPGAGGSSTQALLDAIWELANAAIPGAITQAQADARYVELTGDNVTGPILPATTTAIDLGSATNRWRTLFVQDLNVTAATATTATAGGAPALPATPTGYLTVTIAGTARKVPYYNT